MPHPPETGTPPTTPGRRAGPATAAPPLRALQQAFFAALATGAAGTTAVDGALAAAVAGGGVLDATARVDIYAQMYWMRIVDALHEDFPRVTALIGHEAFHAAARAYLACTPSRHPSLRHVGAGFADFLAATRRDDVPAFLADLARLEWARLEVFDAPDAAVSALGDFRDVPPAEWPALRLSSIPACRIVDLAWPAHEIWAAAEEGAEDRPTAAFHPAPTCLRVWRDDFRVFHTPIGAAERAALAMLAAGTTFGDLCEAVALAVGSERAAEEAGALLLRWVEDHVLAARR